MTIDLENIRREYRQGGLRREQLIQDPIELFQTWMSQAVAAELTEPTAMSMATVNRHGVPNQRTVLLKHVDEKGFQFFTNCQSAKAHDIAENSSVSLHFQWHQLERQVIIQGDANRVADEVADRYFASRPRESQLGAWASHQSQVIADRAHIEQEFAKFSEQFAGQEIPRPPYWGGYLVTPSRIEFWQGGEFRLHDRFVYQRIGGGRWQIDRLSP